MHVLKLFVKDFRLIYRESLFIIMLGIGMCVLKVFDYHPFFNGVFGYYSLPYPDYGDYITTVELVITTLLFFMVPALYLYAMFSERLNATDYQMFSLPVPRYNLLLSKYLLVLCLGILVSVPLSFLHQMLWQSYLSFFMSINEVFIQPFSSEIFILGLLTAVIGITAPLRRNRFLAGFLLVCFFIFFHFKMFPYVNGFMYSLFFKSALYGHVRQSFEIFSAILRLIDLSYRLFQGIVLSFIGFVLYMRNEDI